MIRLLSRFAALFALFALGLPTAAQADPADIDAAARGVVRVVIVGEIEGETFPVSHGTGFAVAPNQIVTNAHVVREALFDPEMRIAIVPAQGDRGGFARPLAVSPENDLALLALEDGPRLAPLTLAEGGGSSDGEVSAVGYPMNVDRAQGLEIADIFRAQPPVKSRGALAGSRPSRDFDTILHTAPIARGNSGGPLLDSCGRVLGVNSFGADSDGADAEFYFAVSMKELLPFLAANGVKARTNALPCRSMAELDAADRARIERERSAAEAKLAMQQAEEREKREQARTRAEASVQEERENAMMLSFLSVLAAAAAAMIGWQMQQKHKVARDALLAEEWAEDAEVEGEDAEENDEESDEIASPGSITGPAIAPAALIAWVIAGGAAIGAAILWFTRPGIDEIERRIASAMGDGAPTSTETGGGEGASSGKVLLACTLDITRSRITGAPVKQMEFSWTDTGCVNTRTQYGFASGDWARVLVPNDEDAVSVNAYDPHTRTFRADRYLLGQAAMDKARAARGQYSAPKCGSDGAAARLGDLQGAVLAQLPERPNERLVYRCEVKR